MGLAKKALMIAAFVLASCSSPVVPAATPTSNAEQLSMSATTATAPLLVDLAAGYKQRNPDFMFELETHNYRVLVEKMQQNETSYYFLSNHLPSDSTLWAAPIGQDGIAIILHPDNTIAELSTRQIRDIYRGRITNWRDVGGMDAKIQVVSREQSAGTRAEFEELVMGEQLTTQSALIAPSSRAMLSNIARQPNSIGYISMGYLNTRVHPVIVDGVQLSRETLIDNTYPLRSTLFIVGRQEPDAAYRVFIGWMQSPEGQSVVARKHAPLRLP